MKLVKKKKGITKEEIFSKISDYDVYRYYFGDFTIGKKYLNHLRGDKKQPSFCVNGKHGELLHLDYGDDYWRGDCISLVRQIYGCDYYTALLTIDRDFNLGIVEKLRSERPEKIITWEKPEIVEEKKPAIIQCITKKFTKIQLDWWNTYELSEADLKAEQGSVKIYAIKSYYINKIKQEVDDLTFGYLFGDKWKIYKPIAPREDKWKTNTSIDLMYGLENIQNCSTSIIVKSVKDYLVSRKFLTSCIAGVQNESAVAICPQNIEYIKANSNKIYTIFDNDDAGVKACKYYNQFGFNYWNIPKRYLTQYGIKDPSDFVYRYGGERLRKEVSKKIQL